VATSNGVGAPWRPFILRPLSKLTLAVVIIAIIFALELTLRRSDTNIGFTDIRSNEKISWTYFAPVVLFFLGVLLSSYTFSVSSLEPFLAMSRAPQPARKSVRYSPAQRTSVGLVFHALRYRSYVGFSCAAIMLIIPFLKIVVSGLITTTTAPATMTADITLDWVFNTTSILSETDEATGEFDPLHTLALSQIETYGLPLPECTTSAGAVGQVDTGELSWLVASAANTTITVPLPVMRSDLENCTALTGSNLILHSGFTLNGLPAVQVQLPIPATTLPVSSPGNACVYNGVSLSVIDFPETISLEMPSSPGWFGQIYAPLCGGYVLIFGKTQDSNASATEEITVVQCSGYSLTQ
jgi:hypothetical protein